MNRLLAAAATCVVAFNACGGGDEPAAPSGTATTDRTELVNAAHGVCEQAQPAQDRATNRIEKARNLEANRAGWQERYEATGDTFARLREVAELGADKPYDTFVAKWGEVLGFIKLVIRDTGDEEEVELSFNAFNEAANELVDTAIAADVVLCATPFSLGGDPAND